MLLGLVLGGKGAGPVTKQPHRHASLDVSIVLSVPDPGRDARRHPQTQTASTVPLQCYFEGGLEGQGQGQMCGWGEGCEIDS
jgi:hypothetical protein